MIFHCRPPENSKKILKPGCFLVENFLKKGQMPTTSNRSLQRSLYKIKFYKVCHNDS